MADKERGTDVLLRNIAAQFREELGGLYLAAETLATPEERKESPLTDRNAAMLDRVRMRLARLAQNLEADANLKRGKPLNRENDDIVRLVSEICEESSDLAAYARVNLMFSCAKAAHTCAIHTEYIRQLVYHLMSNAIRGCAPRGGYVRVSLRFPRSPGRVVLSVQDNGRGIAPDRLPNIFDECMTEFPAKEPPHGAGLGLSVCQRIAEGHGGFMTVKSEEGKGSEFTLCFPDEAKTMVPFARKDFVVYGGGVHPSLIGLADALPPEAFLIDNLL
jgi:signal transduction histidine kinase